MSYGQIIIPPIGGRQPDLGMLFFSHRIHDSPCHYHLYGDFSAQFSSAGCFFSGRHHLARGRNVSPFNSHSFSPCGRTSLSNCSKHGVCHHCGTGFLHKFSPGKTKRVSFGLFENLDAKKTRFFLD